MPTDFLEIYDASAQILSALQTAFTAVGVTNPPATFRMEAGTLAIPDMDQCCRGELTLIIGDTVPYDGSEDLGGILAWHQQYSVTVFRCATTVDDAGRAPTPAADAAVVRQVLMDRQRILRTLRDFFRTINEFEEGDYFDVRGYQISAEGGCCGAVVDFTISILEDC